MGKNKHSKDKIYKTVGELASHHVGANRDLELSVLHRRLKFDSCCLSLGSVINKHMGLCDDDSFCYVFECDSIINFLEKYKVHPVTGKKISDKSSLVDLKFHKNDEGQFHCPVLFKLFNLHSKIVAYRKSGHVISYEAYYQLNLRPQNFKDLLTDEPINKKDVLTIQDPDIAVSKWDVTRFHHVKEKLKVEEETESSNVRNVESKVLKSVLEEYRSKAEQTAEKFKNIFGQNVEEPSTVLLDKFNSAIYSDGSLSRSVTSTIMPVQDKIRAAELNEEQILYPRVKKKGYIQLVTNFGPLNLELYCNRAPKTCHNFLLLATQGYYDNTCFHRLVKNFILQGGDPTGTGTGGNSAWGGSFKDECHSDLKHSERGILAMANSGPDTNKSQFYITLRGNWPHLDGKHTVFGKVVGGNDTLSKIELVDVDKNDKPKIEIQILHVVKYVDPFEEVQKMIEEERKTESSSEEKSSGPPTKKVRSGVGGYISSEVGKNIETIAQKDPTFDPSDSTDIRRAMIQNLSTLKPKGQKPKKKFGDFSGW